MNNDTRVLRTKGLDSEYDRIRNEWRDQITALMTAASH